MRSDESRNSDRDGDANPQSGSTPTDDDYGFSGRAGFTEGNYSSAYGRGTAGERDNPSASGVSGAGLSRGGNALPSPEPEDRLTDDADDADDIDDANGPEGGTGRTGR